MSWIKNNAGLFTLGIFLVAIVAYVETRMGSMETRLNSQMGRLETRINARMDRLETRINARMDRLETRMDRIETRIDRIEDKLDRLILLQTKKKSSSSAKNKQASVPHSDSRQPARADQ